MNSQKQFVSILAEFSPSGKVMPKILIWEDGRKFEIDKVLSIQKTASLKSGGLGLRYTCHICGKLVYLFKDEDSWFLESLS